MEKRGVFILMQPFPGPLAPFNTCRCQHVLVLKRQHLQLFPLGRKWKESSTQLIQEKVGEQGVRRGILSPSAFPPSLLRFAAHPQEGSLPLAEGQVHRPLHSQCSVEWPSASAAILMRLSTSAQRCFQHSLTWGMGTSKHFLTQVSLAWYN